MTTWNLPLQINNLIAEAQTSNTTETIDITTTSANTTFYPTFVPATSGFQPMKTNTDLTYNPSSSELAIRNRLKIKRLADGGAVALGFVAGSFQQGDNSVAIGNQAGATNQGSNCIAMGLESGVLDQKDDGIALGYFSGRQLQGVGAIAIGREAGRGFQNTHAIAIGYETAPSSQGQSSIAIGYQAGNDGLGVVNQHSNSIILNATGSYLQSDGTNRCFVAPVRNDTSKQNQVQYNSGTKELSYVAQVISPITSSGLEISGNPALLSGTSSGNSGQHLVVNINGVPYKIALQNP